MLKELPTRAVSRVQAMRENPFVREFKDFALKGNIMDLAIGIMVGGAFNKIVSSLVNDVIMPPLGLVLGRMDFGNFFIDLSGKAHKTVAEAKAAGDATLNYGLFINNVIDFLIIALITFLIVRQINAWRRTDEAQAAPAEKDCPFCLSHIPLAATRCPHCTSQFA